MTDISVTSDKEYFCIQDNPRDPKSERQEKKNTEEESNQKPIR